MFNRYYQQELQNLRELAKEFSETHPAIAPLLTGQSSDPDVERILEGVAFLTGLLRHKIDDDFPEIVHGLTDVVFPHYLRPIPSVCIVAFSPKPGLKETVRVPAGISLASIPVEGMKCLFRTCFNTEVHPLRLTAADYVQKGTRTAVIRLQLELFGITLSQWRPTSLRFFLHDDHAQAAELFMLLGSRTAGITVTPQTGGEPLALPPGALAPIGFDGDKPLLPFPTHSFDGYRILQEYFLLPEKFFFFELQGLERWGNPGSGARFDIQIEFAAPPAAPPRIRADQFVLHAVPVINLFSDDSDQILLDHRMERIRVRSSLKNRKHYQVYSVDRVVGFEQGSVTKKEYVPLDLFSRHAGSGSVYQVIHSRSLIDNTPEVFLSFTYPPEGPSPIPETLALTLTYTNGALPERLQLGDINQQTSDSPGLLDFRNITSPTSSIEPHLGENALWKLLSHLSMNYLSIAGPETVRELLRLYIFPDASNRAKTAAALKRVEGIQDLRVSPVDRIAGGVIMRGERIVMTVRLDQFAGMGDLYLFGSVINHFFGMYSSMNTFTQFELRDSISGETFQWPPRLGDKPLI